jgi:uncharacterized protein (TIGR02284 family)
MTNNVLNVLNDLLEVTKDGQKGFERAAAEVQEPAVKSLLTECAASCRSGAQELETEVRKLGGDPDQGSMTGALHRGWVNVKSAVTGHDAKAVLNECERGEDYAKAKYSSALETGDLPSDVRTLIMNQYQGVLSNHDRVKSMRDQYAARQGRSPT